jgi:hypothetical protein
MNGGMLKYCNNSGFTTKAGHGFAACALGNCYVPKPKITH